MKKSETFRRLTAHKRTAALFLAACTVSFAATACIPGVPQEQQAEQQPSGAETLSNAVGKATPVKSPTAKQPAGELLDLGPDFAALQDVEAAGDVLALRSEYSIAIGTIEQLKAKEFKTLTINKSCGELSATSNAFVLACPTALNGGGGGGQVAIIDAQNPDLRNVRSAPMKFTSAALTSNGVVIAGSSEENDVYAFRGNDSGNAKRIRTDRKADQIVASPIPGSRDAVVFIDRNATVIQGVDYPNNAPGAALRMGVGVGSIAPGTEGLVFAADTLGHQFGLYTDTDVLRLHQTLPTDASPWAIVADSKHEAVWVASNAHNTVQAFTYNTGVPVGHGKLDTIADVRSMAMTETGSLVLVSDSGPGVQVISDVAVQQAVAKQN
ncbi:YncE family protein [Corynebacterium epidermidicanis]|uniref:Uncharacterized protein n=1 Tax=Corynebacterium epidermidicanis TaxID=1050174 RepID=A0A0G3GRH7_9CORY|nr:hypothetical protein [Corynebacterium epidermidicanis]AKK03160.1 hypothetical protein CEPID_06505 [Corynebacterium epidermidicanis]